MASMCRSALSRAPTTGSISLGPRSAISLTSAPAAKTRSPPQITTARIVSSALTSRAASHRSRESRSFIAFAGGRSSLIVATSPRRSSRTNSATVPPGPARTATRPVGSGPALRLDHSFLPELVELLLRETELATVDLVVVLADLGPRVANLAGRVREARDDVLHQHRPELGMWDADDRLPGEVLRVLDDVGDRVDGGDRRLALRERLHHLLRRPLADPLLDDLVELVDVLDPAHVVGEPRLLDQVRTTDDAHHALGDRLRAGREPEPLAVLREVGVARGGEGSAVAGSALHDAELVVEEGLRAEHPEERLIDREVDDLAPALAAVLAPPKRDHHGRAARERGDAVPERE